MPTLNDTLTWKGAWAVAQSYAEGDAVTDGQRAYVCTDAHTSDEANAPPDADFWEAMVAQTAGEACATPADYHARVDSTDTSGDTVLAEQLLMASRYFEKRLETRFGLDATVTTRVYEPGDQIAPIASTAGLVVKVASGWPIVWADVDPLVINDDFELLPENALQDVPARPFTAIRLRGWSSQTRSYIRTNYRLQVTAIHGWPGGVPEPVKELVIEWTAVWRGESIRTTARVSEMDEVSATSPYHLSQLKRVEQLYHPTGGVAVG